MTTSALRLVPERTAWLSKVNWTQAVAWSVSAAVVLGCTKCDIPAEVQAQLVLVIQGVGAIATWVWRTWFNGTVSPASL